VVRAVQNLGGRGKVKKKKAPNAFGAEGADGMVSA